MRAVLSERFPEHGILGEEFGLDRPDGADALGAGPDRRHPRLHHRPADLRHADRSVPGRPADHRDHRPAGDRRTLDRRRRPRRPVSAAAWRRGRLPRLPGICPTPNCPAPARKCSAPTRRAGSGCAGAVRRNYWGGDCYAYGLLALGQIDIIAECDMKLWDWGALVPVIEGAGGSVTDWHGQPLTAGRRRTRAGGGRQDAAARHPAGT